MCRVVCGIVAAMCVLDILVSASAKQILELESVRTLRIGSRVDDDDEEHISRLRLHGGNDWSQDSNTQTSETASYGVLADGNVWVNSRGEMRVIDVDANEVGNGAKGGLTGAPSRVVRSPSECVDSSSLFDSASDIVHLTHDRSFRCSCEWSEDAPCPFYLRIRRGETVIDEFFVSGNSDIALSEVDPVRARAVVAEASFDPAYPQSDAARKACTPLANADKVNGRYCIAYRGNCRYVYHQSHVWLFKLSLSLDTCMTDARTRLTSS